MKKPCFLIDFHGWHSGHYSDKVILEALKKKFHKKDFSYYSNIGIIVDKSKMGSTGLQKIFRKTP